MAKNITLALNYRHKIEAGKCKLSLCEARFKNSCCEKAMVRVNPNPKACCKSSSKCLVAAEKFLLR